MNHKFAPKLDNIPLELIDPGTRYREDYKDMDTFIKSIEDHGLIHPIAVMELENSTYLLLAGGRRLSAFHTIAQKDTNVKSVPCRIYPFTTNEHERRLIELVENTNREELGYEEEAKLTWEVDRLYDEILGKRSGGSGHEGHSMQDTADLLGKSRPVVVRDIALAEAIFAVPELGKMKNKSEALKALNKMKEAVLQQELAKRIQSNAGPADKAKTSLIDRYMIETYEEGAGRVEDGVVDLVELDPPYNIELRHVVNASVSEMENLFANKGSMVEGEYASRLLEWFDTAYHKLKPDGWIIVWYAMEPWHTTVLNCLRKVGFECNGVHGTWSKNNGNTRTPNIHLANAYEPFLYGRKGNPTLNRQGRLNEFRYNVISDKSHPTEKPIEMYADLFTTFLYPGSLIMSGFLGSGNAILGANNAGLNCFGFEMAETYKPGFILKVHGGVYGQYSSYK